MYIGAHSPMNHWIQLHSQIQTHRNLLAQQLPEVSMEDHVLLGPVPPIGDLGTQV